MNSLPFSGEIYIDRRQRLVNELDDGILLFPGNIDSPMNYKDNVYPFRQDSHMLYLTGIDRSNVILTIDAQTSETILFGDDYDLHMIVWVGKIETLAKIAARAGIDQVKSLNEFDGYISKNANRTIHYLPPYRSERTIKLAKWLNYSIEETENNYSVSLIKGIVKLRSIKSPEEIVEMEKAISITRQMHIAMMQMAKPNVTTAAINARLQSISLSHGSQTAYPNIITNRGHILHNHSYTERLSAGDLILTDGGSQSLSHYAADITRTAPVDDAFTTKQKEIYSIVLKALVSSTEMISPGVPFAQIHQHAARAIANGLVALGLMKGNPEEAVEAGAHALFFPHGLGHMIGLDVHDMEDVGEDHVGYDSINTRSEQFGTSSLRLGRKLEPGFVLTVEPGLYFIPDLIDQWASENKFDQWIDYSAVNKYRDFTGVRIEDNVLVTNDGYRVLGPSIPKSIEEIEGLKA